LCGRYGGVQAAITGTGDEIRRNTKSRYFFMMDEKVNTNPRICLLGASFGTSNMGVNALTAGTLKSFYTKYPHGDLFLLDYGKKEATYYLRVGNETVPVQLVNIRFSKKFYLKNNIALLIVLAIMIRFIPIKRIKEKLISGNFYLSQLTSTDIVVSMAGGDSFSDIYGLGRFFYVALPQILTLFLGKKLIILPQTIGPFYSKIASKVARFILKRASMIYSRDYEGLESVKRMTHRRNGENSNLRFCYDVGFVLDPVRPEKEDVSFSSYSKYEIPLVGLNVSGLLYMGGYSRNNMFKLKIDYRELIFDIIDNLITKNNAAVLLVPHVFGSHEESDSFICEKVYDELKDRYKERLNIASGKYNQNEIKFVIGQCDFFIGSRMHACIAALSQKIPTISIAYSRKFAGVMQSIGVEDLVADPRQIEKAEILRMINESYERRTEIRRHLEITIPNVKEKVLNLFNDLDVLMRT
jgi:colanic acid/amylovoran biosynthesis protein